MNKSELIQRLATANPHLTLRNAGSIVATIFDEISAALSRGNRVEVRGFGVFAVKKRDARIGRDPRNGDKVAVSEKHLPFFRIGKRLHDQLQNAEAQRER